MHHPPLTHELSLDDPPAGTIHSEHPVPAQAESSHVAEVARGESLVVVDEIGSTVDTGEDVVLELVVPEFEAGQTALSAAQQTLPL